MIINKVTTLLFTAAFICHAGEAKAQNNGSIHTYATRYDLNQRVIGTISPDPDEGNELRYQAIRITYDSGGRIAHVEKGELQNWQSEAISPPNWVGFTVLSQVDSEYDSLGHKTVERIRGGGKLWSVTQYSYNNLGLVECSAIRMQPSSFDINMPFVDACTLAGGSRANPEAPDRVTKNIYDKAGQLVQVRNAVGTQEEQAYATYSYTANGKREFSIDANGAKYKYEYNSLDRLSKFIFPSKDKIPDYNSSTLSLALETAGALNDYDFESYGYDNNGNRTSLRRRDWREISFKYDSLNRLVEKRIQTGCAPDGSGACPNISSLRSVYYGYDLVGHQTYARFDGRSLTSDGVNNTYSGFGDLTSSSTRMAGTERLISSKYDADGNRIEVITPIGTWSFEYDGLNRISALKQGSGSSAAARASWIYNAFGLPSKINESGGSSVESTYDAIGRLALQADSFAGSTGNATTKLERNAAGQITKREISNGIYGFTDAYTVNRSYTPNGLNQYFEVGGIKHEYDSNGNLSNESIARNSSGQLVSDGKRQYVYDAENRLVAVGNNTVLTYDPLGRLFEVKTSSNASQFLYDGDQLAVEYDDSGWTNAYIHGPGNDDPLIRYTPDGQTHWLHRNNQGSIVAVAGPTGGIENINTYDEYGIPGRDNAGRFQFTGQAWIPEIGLYYYKARFYSPTLGRFLQTDPIGFDDQINLYAYVGNDPVNKVDPTGLEAACVTNGGSCTDPNLTWRDIGNRLMNVLTVVAVGIDILDTPVSPGPDVSVPAVAARTALREEATTVRVSRSKYPESAAHIERAQAAGHPRTLTVDRPGSPARRREALQNTPRQRGTDRDEYPPAMFREGGKGSSVERINPSDNRGAGASIGRQCRNVPNGSQVNITVCD